MFIAKIQDNQVIKVDDYKIIFPNTSFPESGPSSEFLSQNSCLPVTAWLPYNSNIEKLVAVTPYISENTVYIVNVEPLTPEEIEQNTQSLWAKVRAQRNQLLSESDWTQLPDVPLTENVRQQWVTYREQLRNITDQIDPNHIVWPTPPNSE